ncbi:toll-like receptor 6 [Aphidius gifuensis]|uniref:toll-like receptor 6 n=1 Tax=Aphidius gifuensis TaxID=684658 RepID=UPI001CDD296D|nr:toll-like receptor 6 [Aphidius gifuensis]
MFTHQKVNVIQNNALKNISSLSIKSLKLNLADVKLHIEPLAFSNLLSLENLEINSASVLLDPDIFYDLNNLKYLKIQLANKTKSYLNDVLNKHPNLHELEFFNHQDADICDFTSRDTSLNILHIQYTQSSLRVISRHSFYCLKNLQHLTITESNLNFIVPGTFNALKKLKKVSIVSSKELTRIPSNVFNVRSFEIINLSNNSIEQIDNGAFITGSNRLLLLNLSSNSLQVIQEGIFQNIHCKVIDLTKNKLVYIVDGAFNVSQIDTIYLFDNNLFLLDHSSWGFNVNTIIYLKYTNVDIALYQLNKSMSSMDHNENICYLSQSYYFKICKTSRTKLKSVKNLTDDWQPQSLEITDNNISSIGENAFNNLSIKVLMIKSAVEKFELFPASFAGLNQLRMLKLNTKPIHIKTYIFDQLTSLSFLEISVDEYSDIPLCKLFKNLRFFESLQLIRQRGIDICDNKLCTNNNFNISALHYENGTFTNLQKNALDISYNQIIEIDDGVFKDMNLEHLFFYRNVGVFNNSRYWYLDDSQIENNCVNQDTYRICIKRKTLTSVDIPNKYLFSKSFLSSFVGWLTTSDTLKISDERISSMGKYVFKDLSEFFIHPESFDGLLNLENLELNVGPVDLKENLFDGLISLKYLKIEIKYNPQSPSKYINNVLKTVPSLRVLEIENSDSVNICENPRSNNNLLSITGLYYTGGSISKLPTNSLLCLQNLEKLSITQTQLTTIEAGVFDSMDTLKYINLAFNKITHISTGVFNYLNNLITLELNHNKINDIESKSLLKSGNNNLRLLNLSYNEFTIIKKDTFKDIKCKYLDLSQNKISIIENDAFENTNIYDIFLLNNCFSTPVKKVWKIPSFTVVHLKNFYPFPHSHL